MGTKLRGDMDKLSIVSKDVASAAVPFAAKQPERQASPAGGPKSLTVKLEAADYWALRDFCAKQEARRGGV